MSTKYTAHGFCLSILFVAASALSTGCVGANDDFAPEAEADSDAEDIDDELDPVPNPLNGTDEFRDLNDHSTPTHVNGDDAEHPNEIRDHNRPTHGDDDDEECPSEDDPGVVFVEGTPPMCEGISIYCPSGWEPIPAECGCGCERYGLLPAEDFSGESSASSDPSIVVLLEGIDGDDELDDLLADGAIVVEPPLPAGSLTR